MYYRTHHKEFVIQFQIHQNKELAEILYSAGQHKRQKSLSLKPGYEYKIEITQVGQRSTEGFRNLPKDKRKCQLENELDENSIFKIYTKANCMYECEVEKAYKKCQCIPWDYFHKGAITNLSLMGRRVCQNFTLELTYLGK